MYQNLTFMGLVNASVRTGLRKNKKIIARCKGTITEGQNGSPVKLDRTREV